MIRIANWNVERAASRPRRDAIGEAMRDVNADVWVLTETTDEVPPGGGFRCVARTIPRSGGRPGERWASIWSRFHGEERRTSDEEFTACAVLDIPDGRRLAVYGTVLPWRGSSWRGHEPSNAGAYAAALRAQSADWAALLGECHETCIAGDFNQDLSTRQYYGSRKARRLLMDTLAERGLLSVTGDDSDPVRRLTDQKAACIDHICLSRPLASRLIGGAEAWSSVIGARRVSDHPGVYVDLAA